MSQITSPTREEVYQTLLRSLQRRKGFGIVFIQCSPAEAKRVIERVQQDLPQKQVATLTLTEPIDNLYELVEDWPHRDELNILFIQGLEKSLDPYIKPGYGGDGDYYNLDTVPTILSHLNQRRELFRDHFNTICFVFLLPAFAIKYMIRRAPDFFDWGAGVFDLSKDKQLEMSVQSDVGVKQSFSSLETIQFNPVVPVRAKSFQKNQAEIYFDKGVELDQQGRYEEAIASYDRALQINPDFHSAWSNRGISLAALGRDEEAIASYERALQINPDDNTVWHNRGISLAALGRDP